MNWRRRIERNLLFAVLGGVVANAIYWGLLSTAALHGFAAGALGPAANFLWRLGPELPCTVALLS